MRKSLEDVLAALNITLLQVNTDARPVKRFVHEDKRQALNYDDGRVVFFLRKLEKGKRLDPITIEVYKNEVKLADGFHRLAAHVIHGSKTVNIRVLGDPKHWPT